MIDDRLQANFWLSEFIRSDLAVRKGLSNVPSPLAMANIRNVLAPGMQRVRSSLEAPIQITSGFRSPPLNAALGGAPSSQHMLGEAADFICPEFGTPRAIVRHLMERSGQIRFDQLIFEGSWVHISFSPAACRSEVLSAHFMAGGGVSYTKGLA